MHRSIGLAAAALLAVSLTSCAAGGFDQADACPVPKDNVIALLGATVAEPSISDLTERGTYGDTARWECWYYVTGESPIDRLRFESIDAEEGAGHKAAFFDAEGGFADASRAPRPEWGEGAWVQGTSSETGYIAVFEAGGRLWRLDLGGEVGEAGVESSHLVDALVDYVRDPLK